MSFHYPPDRRFTILSESQYGKQVEFDDEARSFLIQPGQRWLPHTVPDEHHPASIGDIVTPNQWIYDQYGISAAFVSGVRTFKRTKYATPTRQIELLGLPIRWFAIGHFEELKGKDYGWERYLPRMRSPHRERSGGMRNLRKPRHSRSVSTVL